MKPAFAFLKCMRTEYFRNWSRDGCRSHLGGGKAKDTGGEPPPAEVEKVILYEVLHSEVDPTPILPGPQFVLSDDMSTGGCPSPEVCLKLKTPSAFVVSAETFHPTVSSFFARLRTYQSDFFG